MYKVLVYFTLQWETRAGHDNTTVYTLRQHGESYCKRIVQLVIPYSVAINF